MKREWLRWAFLWLACIALYNVCMHAGINHSMSHAKEQRFMEAKLRSSGGLEPFSLEEEAMIIDFISAEQRDDIDIERALYDVIGREFNYVEFGTRFSDLVFYTDDYAHFGAVELIKPISESFYLTNLSNIWEAEIKSFRDREPTHKGRIIMPDRSDTILGPTSYPDAMERVLINFFNQCYHAWDDGTYAATVGWYEDYMDEKSGEIYAEFEVYLEMDNKMAYYVNVRGCPEDPGRAMRKTPSTTRIDYAPFNPVGPKHREAWITHRVLRERVKEAAVWVGTVTVK